jgi:glucosamine kinase
MGAAGVEASSGSLGLGLDVGGSQARWVLADAQGAVLAQGSAPAFSGAQAGSAQGHQVLLPALATLAQAVLASVPPPLSGAGRANTTGSISTELQVLAAITGYDPAAQHAGQDMNGLLAQALGLPREAVRCFNDVELAYRLHFAPGEGFLLYAGTGSIAVHVDTQGELARAGGRGSVLGDEGGGYWIGKEALARVWRAEDAEPGAWRHSALAQAAFQRLGGSDWSTTRQFVHRASRGEWGLLALAVAEAAHAGDATAIELLEQASQHLAQLAQCLQARLGRHPLALAGRVWQLHPLLDSGLRARLGPGWEISRAHLDVAAAAARRAAARALV